MVVDVSGWYGGSPSSATSGIFTPLTPARIVDTRDDTGGGSGPITSGSTVTFPVTGIGGVPDSGVSAVILNITVVDPTGPGYLTIFPEGVSRPLASDLNYAAGETRANLAVVGVGDGGNITIFSPVETHVVVDVAGWIS